MHMKKTLFSLFTALLAVLTVGVATASASVERTFQKSEDTHFVKYNSRLVSINDSIEIGEAVRVFRRNNSANTWVNITDKPSVEALSDLADVKGTIRFKGKVYVGGVDTNGDAALYRKAEFGARPWNRVVSDNFGESGDVGIIDMFKTSRKLYAVVEVDEETAIYRSNRGKSWTKVATLDFLTEGSNAMYISNVAMVSDGTTKYVMAAVAFAVPGENDLDVDEAEPTIYRASLSDLSSWEATTAVKDFPGTAMVEGSGAVPVISHLKKNLVVVSDFSNNFPVEVYETTDGETFTQVGQAGLTDAGTEQDASYIRRYKDELYAGGVQDEPTVYRYDATAGEWQVVQVIAESTGFDFSTRRSAGRYPLSSRFVRYRNNMYQGLFSNVDTESSIYRFSL